MIASRHARAAALVASRTRAAPAAPSLVSTQGLSIAMRAAAPRSSPAWQPIVADALHAASIMRPRCVAAWLGQIAVEAGTAMDRLEEDLRYTSPARLLAVFPSHFDDFDEAAPYCNAPEALANRVYADRLGNGPETSGDGWTFRGRGLIQITGRASYEAFARAAGRTLADTSDWCATQAGAAASACWFWNSRSLSPHADLWQIAAITRAINGPGMAGHARRLAASTAALAAMGV